ncbi:MAG TPA: hypothetical protein VM934_07505 [Pyrinomonadaceae bacterium]|nr:hypothetical protein [Pyrinomonadaceae bacterium]
MFEQGGRDVGDSGTREPGPKPSRITQAWTTASAVCLIGAVILWLQGQPRATFVVAVLGVVAWFLNVRSQLPRPPDETEEDDDFSDDDEDDTDEDERA